MTDRYVYNFDELRLSELMPGFMHLRPLLDRLRDGCVVANGCFDLLHPGHLMLLRGLDCIARSMECLPVVAINSDESVGRLKGPGRPVVPQLARATLLASLEWPLGVLIFDEDTPQVLMDTLRPRAVVKGSEYSEDSVIRWSGSEVLTVDMLSGWSTTGILGKR